MGNWELELRTQKIWASSEAFKVYGIEQKDEYLPLKLVQQIVLPEYRSMLDLALHDLVADKKEYKVDFKIKRVDNGHERWVHSEAEIILDEDKKPIKVNGVIQDITERKKAEAALVESETNYKNLINGMPESAWVIDDAGNFLEVNDAAVRMLGYSREELQSLGIKGIDSYLSAEQVKGLVSRTFLGETNIFETEHTAKDGRKIPVEISSSLITYKGKPMSIAIARDITERKKTDDALRKSLSDLEESQRIAGLGTYIWNISTGVFNSSQILDNLFGIDKIYDHTTEGWLSLIHPDDGAMMMNYVQNEVVGKKLPFDKEYRIVRPIDKAVRCLHGLGKLEFDADGQPITMNGTIQDITERKKAEEALKKAKEQAEFDRKRLETVLESTPSAVVIIDAKSGKFSYVNKRASQLYGFDTLGLGLDENVAKVKARRADGTDYPIEEMPVSRSLNLGQEVRNEEMIIERADGHVFPITASTAPLRDMQGNITAAIVVFEDITEQKKDTEKLRESEHLTQKMLFCSPNLIYIYDLSENRNIYANREVLDFLGYTPDQIASMGSALFANILHPDDAEAVALHHARFLDAPDNATFDVEYRMKHQSGEWRWLHSRDTLFARTTAGVGKQILGICEDITERKKNEDVLRQERDKLESLTKNIGAGLVMISKDYRILWMNDYLRQFGDASIGNPCYSSFNTCTHICPDCGPKKIFEGADFDRREYCNQIGINKDRPVWFELIATPIKDNDGNVVAALELTVNITAKKEAESKLKENSDKIDLMNEKLRVVGSLTRHDVGNKLMVAKSNLFLLKKQIGDNPKLAKYLDNVEGALVSSDRIFEFSRLYEQYWY